MTDDRADYIRGLRELAQFLDNNPEAPLPMTHMNVPVFSNDKVTAFGALDDVQLTPTADNEGNLTVIVKLGAIEYRVYGYADWDAHVAAHEEKQARTWADRNGHQLVPNGEMDQP